MNFNNSLLWKEEKEYYILLYPQKTDEWKTQRDLLDLTSSNFGKVNPNCKYCNIEELKEIKQGKKQASFTEAQREAMETGVLLEPQVRQWYETTFGTKVEEYSLIVPKWNTRIGASTDGFVGEEGCIEIKCTKGPIYYQLKQRMKDKTIPIYTNHYDQIQGCMQICNRKWCDYIVYSVEEDNCYVERIYRDDVYWNTILYPHIQNFISLLKN